MGQSSSRMESQGDVSSSQISMGHLKLWQEEVALGHSDRNLRRVCLVCRALLLPTGC